MEKIIENPVLLAGGVKTMPEAEELLKKGAADLIGVGRALMKDCDWECGKKGVNKRLKFIK